jgi:lysophospholipase L1-like esterase
MNKIHRGDDYEGEIVISGTTLDELANIMIEVIDAKKNIIKKISLNEKTGYNSDDISQVDDTTVEFRIHRAETEEMALGKVNFRVSLAYINEDFDDSIKIESDATNSLYIVSDSSETSLQDSVETISVASMAGEENTGENLGDGVGIYKEKSDVTLQFKTLVAGDNITIEANEDEETVTISATVDSGDANNISDTDAEDLTDGGDSELHYHSSDRDRSNHTGTQLLETISDAGTLASKNTVSESEIDDEAVTDDKLSESGVTAGTYNVANVTVNSKGRITYIEEGEVSSDVDLTNYFDKTSDTVSESLIDDGAVTDDKLSESGVTAGTYSIANVTVNSKGRITSIEEGSVSSSGVVDSEATEDSTNAAMSGDLWEKDNKLNALSIGICVDYGAYNTGQNLDVGDTFGGTITSVTTVKCGKVICEEGDEFILKTVGANYARAYCFCDADGVILEMADASVSYYNDITTITAPASTAVLYLNNVVSTYTDGWALKKSKLYELISSNSDVLEGNLLLAAKYSIESNKDKYNALANSGEDDFPQSILSTTSGTVTEIDNTGDMPFDVDTLPTLLQYVGSGSGDFKFEFYLSSLIGTGAISFSFWTKTSQLEAIGRDYFETYSADDIAWIKLYMPSTVGGSNTYDVHEGTTITKVMEYGDWVMYQFQFTNFTTSPFRLRLGVSTSETLYLANIIGINEITDIDPYTARLNGSSSSQNKRLSNLEEDVAELQGSKEIICIGDSLTAGSYPTYLSALLGSDYNVLNRGVGGESTKTIMARQGGSPMYVSSITIPADLTPVTIGTLASSGLYSLYDDSNVTPLLQHTDNAGINPCYIEGIEGTLEWTGESSSDETGTYTFTRTTAGEARTTRAKSLIATNLQQYRSVHCTIIFMGQNGVWGGDADTLLEQYQLMTSFINSTNFIVITTHSSSTTDDVINTFNYAYRGQYIDLRTYMSTWAIYDAISKGYLDDDGTYPTTEDLTYMEAGNCPPSLLSDTIHFNSVGYQLFADLIYQKQLELGII